MDGVTTEAQNVIEAQSIPKRKTSIDGSREIYATVAYHYPQYTLQDVANMPYRDVKLLLKIAERIQADKYLTLTQIAASPHTEKGKGVKNLVEHFKRIIER
jgi:hypothetical protein